MDTLLTIANLAETLQLTESAIRKFVLENSIPYIKIGGAVRFRPSEIEQWIESRRNKANRTATKK